MKILIWGPAPFGNTDYSRLIATVGAELSKSHQLAYFANSNLIGINGLAFGGSPVFAPDNDSIEQTNLIGNKLYIDRRQSYIIDLVAAWKPDVVLQMFNIFDIWPEGMNYIKFPVVSYSHIYGTPLRDEQTNLLRICSVNVATSGYAAAAYRQVGLPVADTIMPLVDQELYSKQYDRQKIREQLGIEKNTFFVLLSLSNTAISNIPNQVAAWLEFKIALKAKTKLALISDNKNHALDHMIAKIIPKDHVGDISAITNVAREELPGYYHAADVLLHCPHSEGLGLSVLEAGSCGLPAIVTKFGVLDELITAETGWPIPISEEYCPPPLYQFLSTPKTWLITEALKDAYLYPHKLEAKSLNLLKVHRNQSIPKWLKIFE